MKITCQVEVGLEPMSVMSWQSVFHEVGVREKLQEGGRDGLSLCTEDF